MAHPKLEESKCVCIKKTRDDHNRYVTGSQIFRDGIAENVIRLLERAIHEQAKPREILSDHGSQFWGIGKPTGELSTQWSFFKTCHKSY